jgi:gliding motility-associated-like protein
VLAITNPVSVCAPLTVNITSSNVTLGSTGGGILTYYTESTGTTVLTTPAAITATGKYYIKATSGSCTDFESVDVTINPTPVLSITNPTAVCSPLTIDITAPAVTNGSTGNGILTYWSNATATNSISNQTAINATGNYFIKSTLGLCTDIKQVDVTINTTPVLAITNPASVCAPLTVNLTSSNVTTGSTGGGILSYWTDPLAVSQLSLASSISTTGRYYIKATSGTCSDIKPVDATINPTPVLTITNPNGVCSPLTIDITNSNITNGSTGNGLLTYWSNASATNSISNQTAINTSGNYFIKSTIGTCTDIKPVMVTINTTPVLMITDPLPVCSPATINITTLNVTNGSTGNGILSYYTDVTNTNTLVDPTKISVAGIYYIKSANGNCTDSKAINVTFSSTPKLIINNPAEVCQPETVDITNPQLITSSSTGTIISYYSNNLGTIPLTTPNSIRNSGTYYIKSTQNGCSTIYPIIVKVNPKPTANFVPTPPNVTTINPRSTMLNTSLNAVEDSWVFSDGMVSSDVSPEHEFPNTEQSKQVVILIVTSDAGCKDTTNKIINVNEEVIYYIPNTFTPDNDDFNQVFKPVFTSGYDPFSYHLSIFNRWGELVFESNDATIGWSGLYGKDGALVQEGSYTWKIDFKLKQNDARKVEVGSVNILR